MGWGRGEGTDGVSEQSLGGRGERWGWAAHNGRGITTRGGGLWRLFKSVACGGRGLPWREE